MPRVRAGEVRACEECGKERYLPPSQVTRSRYCSRACQSAAAEKRQARTCPHCGKPFVADHSVGRYCSWQCYQASRVKSPTCLVCQKPLDKTQYRYCSHACRDTGRRTLETRPCEQCGAPMKVEFKLLATRRFCSRACANEAKRIKGPGARIKRQDGYIQVYYPTHPDASKQGFILEHRLVAEQKYSRRILPTEHVHHVNGVRDDNSPENLEIVDPSRHAGVSNRMAQAKRKALRDRLAEYERRFGPLT